MDIAKIQKRIKVIEGYKEECKKAREMIKSALENDSRYTEATETAKEAAEIKKRIKNEIMGQPENEKLAWQIKENTEEMKINNEILAQELMLYYQKSKSNEIEDENGGKRKFELKVKLFPAQE